MLVSAASSNACSDSSYLDSKRSIDSYIIPLMSMESMDDPQWVRKRSNRQRLQARQSNPALSIFSTRNYQSSNSCHATTRRRNDVQADHDSSSKQQRRPGGFRQFFVRPSQEARERPYNATLLHPDTSLQNNRLSTYSAPDELEHYHARALSDIQSLEYGDPLDGTDGPLPTFIPRSPTYPPSTGHRSHSSRVVGDTNFVDEQEFCLFAQATAGLGPEQAFRQTQVISSPDSARLRTQPASAPLHRSATTGHLVSPVNETPTTMYALHQLPQMPERRHYSHRERLGTSTPALDPWLQHPPSNVDILDTASEEDFDDELPDYAESQAQAQAYQRAEAARRAQELQRSWQLSGGRRGI